MSKDVDTPVKVKSIKHPRVIQHGSKCININRDRYRVRGRIWSAVTAVIAMIMMILISAAISYKVL